MDLMASNAVVYSAPHTIMDLCGWYTTTVLHPSAPPSRSEVTATCGSCGMLCNLSITGTGLAWASWAGPAYTSNTIGHSTHPHTAMQTLSNANSPGTTHRGGGSKPHRACGVRRRTNAGSSCCRCPSRMSPYKNIREAGGPDSMDSPGQSGFQSLSLYPPNKYAWPAADCVVRLVAFLCPTGSSRW